MNSAGPSNSSSLKKQLSISNFPVLIESRGRDKFVEASDFRRLLAGAIYLFTHPKMPDEVEGFMLTLGKKLEEITRTGEDRLPDDDDLVDRFRALLAKKAGATKTLSDQVNRQEKESC